MRVLLDECVPRKLKRELTNHEVLTVTENGWSGFKNGELLAIAEVEFDIFLTVDQNLSFQQNLKSSEIGIHPNGGQKQSSEDIVAADARSTSSD